MIEYIKGDLLKSDCDVIIHGCNCFHTMGSGIAKSIKEIYPEAYDVDKQTVYRDKRKLGQISYARVQNKYFPNKFVYVINAYTQYDYGRRDGVVYANYDAIRTAMEKINNLFPEHTIGMPKIGAGLAKGDWKIIESIINDVFKDRIVYVYEFNTEQEVNGKTS